jgi:hypothetical protein
MVDQTNQHAAQASATGYLFQCRFALLLGLQAIGDHPQLQISLERFDDIAFDKDGDPVQIIQTKHHLVKKGNLTDASVDLWKTLHIWTKLSATNADAPFRIRFVLLTTSDAPQGSAAAYLRARDRDESKADAALIKTASQSTNKENALAYKAYKDLDEPQRLNLLRAIIVLDGSPNILDVRDEICRELRHAVSREHIDQFVERLEGWWFGVVIRTLAGERATAVPVLAIDNRLDELREEFRRDALPVDFSNATPPQSVVAELDRRPFVRQLRHIEIGDKRVEYAIRDFYRAAEQRSKWAREDLLVDGELEKYDRGLVEAWEPRFAAMLEGLPSGCQDRIKVAAGQSIFRWVENDAIFLLRSVRDRFLTHGSFHILSNRYVVGWHPDYASQKDSNEE